MLLNVLYSKYGNRNVPLGILLYFVNYWYQHLVVPLEVFDFCKFVFVSTTVVKYDYFKF